MALPDRPADERVPRPQIENVELVDPRRDDQQRPPLHGFGRRRVLDQLDQIVLVDDLARRRRDVLADLERRHVGHADMQPALAALEIVEQVLQPVQQVLAAAFDRRAQHLGIGHHEIRRRQRVDELARIEIDLARGALVEPFDLLDRALHPARGQQIALLDEVEQRVVAPRLVAKAAVLGGRLDDRLGLAAEKPLSSCAATAADSRSTATAAPAPAATGPTSAAPSSRKMRRRSPSGWPCRSRRRPPSPSWRARKSATSRWLFSAISAICRDSSA